LNGSRGVFAYLAAGWISVHQCRTRLTIRQSARSDGLRYYHAARGSGRLIPAFGSMSKRLVSSRVQRVSLK